MQPNYQCQVCGKSYVVKAAKPDGRYLCPQCKRLLVPTGEVPKTSTAMATAKTPPKPAAPAIAGRPGRRQRRERKGSGTWIAWVAALLIAAVGGYFLYKMIPPSRGPSPEKVTAAARQDFTKHGVPLTIEEPAGVERKAEPVTSGVPLPQGSVSDPAQLSLADEKGQPVPCQFTPQCRWPDGSIKWVLLDFQADVPAKGKSGYKLCMGGSPATPKESVRVIEAGSTVIVSTGDFSFDVSKDAACLVRSVKLADKSIVAAEKPIQAEMVNADGKVYRASKPTEVVVEAKGPMRTTVLVRGEFVNDEGGKIFNGKVGYDLRLTAYAGKPWVKMAFTLTNNGFYGYRNERKPRQWLYFKSLRLDMPVVPAADGGQLKARFPDGLCRLAPGAVNLTQWFKYPRRDERGYDDCTVPEEKAREEGAQVAEERSGFYYRITRADKLLGHGARSPGWIALVDGEEQLVGYTVRSFWQNFPRGLQASTDGLSVLLWPEGGFWPRTQEAHDANTYQLEGGRHKTAEVLMAFGEGAGKICDLSRSFEAPLAARAAAEWYRDSGTVWPLAPGPLATENPEMAEAVERYERLQLAKVHDEYGEPAGEMIKGWGDEWGVVSIPSVRERCPEVFYGWMNFGDLVWSHGYCSLFYDWPYAMLMQHLRFGDESMFSIAGDMVRHRYDIDQYHVVDTAPWLGGFQRYEKGEHGHLARQAPHNTQGERNTVPSHTWNRGLLLHWALTGDPRSMDAALENGQAYRNMFYSQHKLGEKDKLPWGEFRSPGWAIENWLALYEYTGEKKYLDWANEVFTKTLLAMEKDNGSCGHIIKDGKQCAQFTAYIVEPVCRLHHITGRADAAEFLRRVLDWQREKGCRGGQESGGKYRPVVFAENWDMVEEGDLNAGAGVSFDFLLADGYAYLYRVFGRKQDMLFARQLFKDSVFYYGFGLGADRAARTPIGYHYLGYPFGMTPKIHAYNGRYHQLYLQLEEETGGAKMDGRPLLPPERRPVVDKAIGGLDEEAGREQNSTTQAVGRVWT